MAMTPIIDTALMLTDHFGASVTFADYRGKYLLVFFGFTHCRVVCPRALGRLGEALDRLGPASRDIVPLYVTVDPARDTPEVMRAFLEEKFPRFTGLTGTPEQIAAAKSAFRVFAEKRPDPQDPQSYDVPHTSLAYLLDRQGQYLLHIAPHLEADAAAQRLRGAVDTTSATE